MGWRSRIYGLDLRISRRTLLTTALGFVVVSFLVYFWNISRPAFVNIEDPGGQISFETRQKDLSSALIEQGITLSKADRVIPALTTPIKPAATLTVQIHRALQLTLVADGTEHKVQTLAQSVGELLREQQIALGDNDSVSVDTATTLVSGMTIAVTRRSEITRVRAVEIPFQTLRQEDRSLMLGETKELQAGSKGLQEVIELIALEDGKEIEVKLASKTIVVPPVDQVIAYGTVGVVARGGTEYRYSREFQVTATGYTAGKESNPDGNGYTYTGMKAVRGVVAVDPNVIPLYTRLYIEGYGPAIAGDIGGAIKGNRIDLCFNTVDEALQWGVRPAKVYVLTD